MLDALTADIPKPIVVPEGKMAAPGDFRIENIRIRLTNRTESIPLIRQTKPGNCAEYTALNTAIVLEKFGIEVNDSVLQYMRGQPDYNLPTVENDLTIPLVLRAQENMKTLSVNGEQIQFPSNRHDVDNLTSKYEDPYEPLTNTNSALLFREIVSPKDTIIEPTDFVTSWSDSVGRKLTEREVQAIFIGSGDHATSIVKLGERYLYIDPYNNPDIVQELNLEQARFRLAQSLARPNAFATFNDVRMR